MYTTSRFEDRLARCIAYNTPWRCNNFVRFTYHTRRPDNYGFHMKTSAEDSELRNGNRLSYTDAFRLYTAGIAVRYITLLLYVFIYIYI